MASIARAAARRPCGEEEADDHHHCNLVVCFLLVVRRVVAPSRRPGRCQLPGLCRCVRKEGRGQPRALLGRNACVQQCMRCTQHSAGGEKARRAHHTASPSAGVGAAPCAAANHERPREQRGDPEQQADRNLASVHLRHRADDRKDGPPRRGASSVAWAASCWQLGRDHGCQAVPVPSRARDNGPGRTPMGGWRAFACLARR